MKLFRKAVGRLAWGSRKPETNKEQQEETRVRRRTKAKKQRQHPQHPQHPPCALLQLPVELLLLIAGGLPRQGQLVLAQACRPLRAALWHNLHLDTLRLSRGQRLGYLACLARDAPDKWVCESCVDLARASLLDTPQTWTGLRWHVHQWDNVSQLPSYRIQHRHVQLTLKYTRMGRRALTIAQQVHLDRLLAPYGGKFKRSALAARYSACPRVVQGRYLLLSVWRYDKRDPEVSVSLQTMGLATICPHEAIGNFYWDFATLLSLSRLIRAAHEAFGAPDGAEVCGACSSCRTDFAVQASPDGAVLRCWQDLGDEGPPTDPVWRAALSHDLHRVTVDHEPGSVRQLYGPGTEADWQIDWDGEAANSSPWSYRETW